MFHDFGSPADIYLLRVNDRNTLASCENVFKVNTKEHISHFDLVFALLTLNM